jgi:hypothetical protein
MLTSTLTRPTTISPTASYDTKVSFQDVIDIAPIPEPKPRIISLEPIARRARQKPSARKRPSVITEDPLQVTSGLEPARSARGSELNSVADESDAPGSPAPSDVSFESRLSSGNASGTEYGIRSVNTNLDDSMQNANRTGVKGKTITATMEVLKGGYLRGDYIPVKILVNHTKHIRSLKGIIVTLYRQARVDMHPALPVASNSKGDRTKSEDYYPKSRTGLGGLSLSSAGSSHLFRKDLSQSFAPLFVDPRTLTADVKCSVRVPDEAFPTISNVPGAMISFKYFVEVVVDIQGKLTGLDRMFPNSGLVTKYGVSQGTEVDDAVNGTYATWGGNFVDTDAIRRERGIVSSLFEVVVGTKDSTRNGKQRQQQQQLEIEQQPGIHDIPPRPSDDHLPGGIDQGYRGYDEDGQYYDHYAYDDATEGAWYDGPAYEAVDSAYPPYQPPPNMPEEEELTEKERIKRAEARLLPSQPLGVADSATPNGTQQGIPASAPILPDDDDEPYPAYYPPGASSSSSHPPPFTATSTSSRPPTAPPLQRRITDDNIRTTTASSSLTINANTHQPSALPPPGDTESNNLKPLPNLPPHSPAPEYTSSSSSHIHSTDDKQELQYRRLHMETSAPPDRHEGDTPDPSAPPIAAMLSTSLAPSAPVLDEDDEGLVGPVGPSGAGEIRDRESLPRYQR